MEFNNEVVIAIALTWTAVMLTLNLVINLYFWHRNRQRDD
jgi:hypothetical protein